jgi:hypothetical protein
MQETSNVVLTIDTLAGDVFSHQLAWQPLLLLPWQPKRPPGTPKQEP